MRITLQDRQSNSKNSCLVVLGVFQISESFLVYVHFAVNFKYVTMNVFSMFASSVCLCSMPDTKTMLGVSQTWCRMHEHCIWYWIQAKTVQHVYNSYSCSGRSSKTCYCVITIVKCSVYVLTASCHLESET